MKTDPQATLEFFQEHFGIDLERYQDNEALARMAEVLQFRKYLLWSFLLPLLAALFGWMAFGIWLGRSQEPATVLGGLLLFLPIAVGAFILLGLLNLSRKLKSDTRLVAEHTLGVAQQLLADLRQVATDSRPELVANMPSSGNLFRDLARGVLLPALLELLRRRSLFWRLGAGLLGRMVSAALNILQKRLTAPAPQAQPGQHWLTTYADDGSRKLQAAQAQIDNILNISTRLAVVPLRLALLALALLGALLWLLFSQFALV